MQEKNIKEIFKKYDFENLPPKERKTLKKYLFALEDKQKHSKICSDFLTFVKHMWPEFIEGYHHKIIAEKFNELKSRKIKRLIVNMPPRHTKSEFASFLLPAWMIGNNPKLKKVFKIGKQAISSVFFDKPKYNLKK